MQTTTPSLFAHYCVDLFVSPKNISHVLKEHASIPLIIDTLSRKQNHHVVLTGITSEKILLAFLHSIALHLIDGNAPKTLRDVDFYFFNTHHLSLNEEVFTEIYQEFLSFRSLLHNNNKRAIIAFNEIHKPFLTKLIAEFATDEHLRLISLHQYSLNSATTIHLSEPSDNQLLALLKTYKDELEDYHHVLIPEETFAAALSMTTHYLTNQHCFEKTLELLDSACARASALDHNDPAGFKPIVSNTTLSHVVSSWTQIPLANLYNNAFQASKFIEALQRRVFGQETAIGHMASALQHAYVKLHQKSGPLCSLLLVGANETGKTTAALTMAEHLFGHKNAFLRVNLNDAETYQSIGDVKIISDEHPGMSLLTAIQQTPYGIVLLENIHQTPPDLLNLFKNIFAHGFALDAEGKKYSFKHAIFVITTTVGSERIATLTHAPTIAETNKSMDLMQLVLSDHADELADPVPQQLPLQEICDELIPVLETYFSPYFLQHLHVIPFLPMDYLAVEKIIRSKIKLLASRLEMTFGIELSYAAEIVKFLAHEAFWRKAMTKSLDKLLEELLYSAVASAIVSQTEEKNRSHRLQLQLNDGGQLLRCEWMGAQTSLVF